MADSESPALDTLVGDRARDDHGRFLPVTPTEPAKAPPAPEPKVEPVAIQPAPTPEVKPAEPVKASEPPGVPLSALLDEREKRQAHERRLKELEAELAAIKKPETQIDPWQDLPGALAKQRDEIRRELHAERVAMSEDMARAKYKDFDEVIGHFEKAVQANPALAAQMNANRNPAEFAYQQGVWHREMSGVPDPVAYRSKLESDIRAKVEAEFKAKYGDKEVPTSLNGDPSPQQADPVYQGPPPLNTLIGPKASRR